MRLIDADYLKSLPFHQLIHTDYGDTCVSFEEIDNAPTVKPCENCDLYFKAMTKEEMKKGGAE